MKLTNAEVQELYTALTALSEGRAENGGEQAAKTVYKFSGQTLLKLARNIHAVKHPALMVQDVVHRRHRELINGAERPPIEALTTFENEITVMMKEEEDYKLVTLRPDELNLDENAVPPAVLAGMIPILED